MVLILCVGFGWLVFVVVIGWGCGYVDSGLLVECGLVVLV